MNKKDLVFVYGTLKRGFGNHSVMESAGGRFVKQFTTRPIFTMVSLGAFPALLVEGNTAIKGEVYEVDNIKPLDRLEGYPDFYDRVQISVGAGDKAWVYIMDKEELEYVNKHFKIESGEWRE